MRDGLRRVAVELLDLVYPPCCLACDRLIDAGRPLCGSCGASVVRIDRRGCRRCGAEPLRGSSRRPSACRRCLRRPFAFRRALAALRYSGAVREGIVRLKFQQRREAAPWLAAELADALRHAGLAGRAHVVVPVPLHPLRRLTRGFDQAELIAALVAKSVDRPLVTGAIRRARLTAPQSLSAPSARRVNPEGAFVPGWRRRAVRGRRVLLIDDVMSSGSTAHEAAVALLSAGAIAVDVGVVAT